MHYVHVLTENKEETDKEVLFASVLFKNLKVIFHKIDITAKLKLICRVGFIVF